jgi:hypothetical protein
MEPVEKWLANLLGHLITSTIRLPSCFRLKSFSEVEPRETAPLCEGVGDAAREHPIPLLMCAEFWQRRAAYFG